ncbi:MAG TPA: IS200/IS605 family transposase [Pyrinomonadaceae bacterium]|nr:IS200/IS605 family transposase [Pyrinomonadaceae bacterium]HMP65800.1 IS200/IS605 family transposase [Pyrinomonadaceae bacterium]
MSQTLVTLCVHVVFSTKNRMNLIDPKIEERLFAYIGGIANNHGSKLIAAGGTANHVHLLISLGKTVALSVLVGHIKRETSAWFKNTKFGTKLFAWQDGYGAFSVGPTQIGSLKKYIGTQKEHHHGASFEDEMRYFLRKYSVEFDERYVWD